MGWERQRIWRNILNFVHIPKTAGTFFITSVAKQNNINILGHTFCYGVEVLGWESWIDKSNISKKTYIGGFGSKSNLVSCVRNPFDLFASYFSYNGKDGSLGWGNCREIHGINDFNEFVEFYIDCDENEFHFPPFERSLFAQIYDKRMNYLNPDVIRFENLDSDIKKFCKKYSLKFSGGIKNESKQKKPTNYLEKHVEKLRKIWKDDLRRFNYDFYIT